MTQALDLGFQHPEWLFAIVPAVLITLALFTWNFRSVTKAFAQNALLRLHFEDARPQVRAHLWRALLFSVLFTLLIVAATEPERRTYSKESIYGGVRIAFLLDVSLSMKYAHDVEPYSDRLVAAKSVLESFAAMTENDPAMRGEYWRSIIPFAGAAITYLPFTAGYDEFISAINAIDETTINDPGTNFLQPIQEYEQMLKDYPSKSQGAVDILVLISDGGKGEGTHKDLPYIKAAFLRMPQTVVFTVGIGSVEVTTNPDGTEQRRALKVPLIIKDREGRVTGRLYQDADPAAPDKPPAPMSSELDERILTEIAGSPERYIYYQGKDVFLGQLKQMILEHRKLVDTKVHTHGTPIAHWFLIPAILISLFLFGYLRRLRALLMFVPSRLLKRIRG